ncbi:autotransporter outer membrane beta-barrel domain-containing protein [Avibacterium paragallinarum]|uniref:Autotransporter outer membrane beta-barrel domain-containing protein n=5 Tax=Avibacterium paragallinarum TaxID=728 RepID=A0ABU7QIR8_AVIPA|nr:autotransporter outer membrane beta-barrel domain-containing protein [Avibacterium paragallinarum]MEE3609063.1 autotransporter outer membrane beta-barrel domain-containing protein [Avibacterium paragallinarum]MEE3669104.1 autotransporter outer membrane beta-barrel domain-containing protein [Avibacterium paragallinarum]MEE4386239.1 autotransporter outer membrane beta-barrel domain-containing protein [Avibacterium paragallinarum]WAL55632.1 autotransporter outer membrane beta-barrel domain-cont
MKTNLKTWLAVLGLVSLVMPNVVIAKDEDSGKTSGKPTLEEFKDSIGEWLEDCRENPEGERCTEEELKEDMLDLIDKLDDKARGEARKWLKEEKGYNLDKSPGPKEPETPPDSGITNSETPTPQPPSQPQQPTMSWLALAPRVNLEQGFASVRTLHERRGENWELKETEGQPWGRVLGDYLTQKGDENASFKLRDYGFQLGYDRIEKKEVGHRLTGIFAGYRVGKAKFYGEDENKHPRYQGKLRTHHFHLGAEHTRYAKDGGYVDLVGLMSYFRNQYQARLEGEKVRYSGFGVLFSVEAGKPFAVSSSEEKIGWFIEPQAQLIYQFIASKNPSDKVEVSNSNALRGRVGVRVVRNRELEDEWQARSLYAVANIWKDFYNRTGVRINDVKFEQGYGNLWWEAGVGLQLPLSRKLYLYTDVRYEQQFGHRAGHHGYRGVIGLKYN